MVIDSGLPTNFIKDTLQFSSTLVDYVKLGWGTALVTDNLKEKIDLYQSHDVPVCFGGTFFELAYLQKKVPEFQKFAKELGLSIIEISDGTIELPKEEKLEFIQEFSKSFRVLSEFGSKDAQVVHAPRIWVHRMEQELEAGAWKVIAEGRESGTAGMYRPNSDLRTGLVDEIVLSIPQEKLLWEAPKKEHQAWFIRKFGTNVNLGNIHITDLIPLETLRLGLRSDTLLHFHGDEKTNPPLPPPEY